MTKAELMAKIEAMKNKQSNTEPHPETYTDLNSMKQAAQEGKLISLSNMAELVNKPKEQAQQPTNPTTEKSKLVSFTIMWHEGTNEFEGAIFDTWGKAQRAMMKIYKDEGEGVNDGCYTKVKICVKWENGKEITDRCDIGISSGDFNPSKMTVGEYLSKCKGVMYESNLMQGERGILSWEDEPTAHQPEPIAAQESNLTIIPDTLKKLLGIVEVIEESNDNSKTALIQAAEQVERCRAYITYLTAILPILEAKTAAMIEAKHKPAPITLNTQNSQFN